tara:strand:+ start:481 stop:747 length:267 start_codon:yes stop_codon:yes gene_type:complete
MASPNIAHAIGYIQYCRDLEYLTQQHKELIDSYNYAGYEQDAHSILQDDSPLARCHQAFMDAIWQVIEMTEIRIKDLGGTIPGYGEVA